MDDVRSAATGRGRRLGHFLTVVGALGVLAAVGTIVAAGRMVTVFDDDLDASTEVTLQAIDAADESVLVLESLVDTIHAQSGPVVAALRDTATSIESSTAAVESAAGLAEDEIPETITAIADVFPSLESAAAAVDLALTGLSNLPIGPDYDPEVSLDETLAEIGAQLDQLADRVDRASTEFVDVADALEKAPGDLRAVADAIEQLDEDLVVDDLVGQYEATLADARRVAVESLDNVDSGSDWLVAAVIALAVVFGLGQVGTIWLGRHLVTSTSTRREPPPPDPATGGST